MKKIILLMLLILPGSLSATETKSYKWEDKKTTLKVTRNYGTPLSEELRARSEREKSYRIFNLMRNSKKELNYEIYWKGYKYNQSGIVRKIDIASAAEDMGLDISKVENFAPEYSGGKLWYMNWSGDILSLLFGEAIAYRSPEVYTFCGLRGENLVINKGGRLIYLSEVEWLDVPSLAGYTVSKSGWVDDNSLIVYAQNINTSGEVIIITPVRQDEPKIISVPRGELLDLFVTEGGDYIYAVSLYGQQYNISAYLWESKKWQQRISATEEPLLLNVSEGRVIWYDRGTGAVKISGGGDEDIEGFELKDIVSYPRGRYTVTDNGVPVGDPETEKTAVLFYPDRAGEKLKKYGISVPAVCGLGKDIWLLPAKYSKNFDKFPEDTGSLTLDAEGKKVYYSSPGSSGLRDVKSLKLRAPLRPAVVIGAVLFIVIIMVILFKRKE
ncbi:MAG: hypothetical protein U9R36_00545 [Elusimicrobiota bacterium]|nr:hypothetical protein [Elusimicrobiota bacterium]